MKRFLSVFLCFALLFCVFIPFSPSARAISPELILASSAAGLFSLVSSLMAVNYSFSNFTLPSLNDFFQSDPLTEIGRFWVSNISGGMIQLRGDLSSLRALADIASTKIDSLALPDNSSGTAYSFTGLEYDGYPLDHLLGTRYHTSAPFGSVSVEVSSGAVFRTYGDYWIMWQYGTSRYDCTLSFYHGDDLLGSSHVTTQNSFTAFPVLYTVDSGTAVNFGYYNLGYNYTSQSVPIGEAVGLVMQADYVTGVIDSGIADTVPPTGGIQVTMPYTGQPDVSSLLDSLNDAILSGDTSTISAEILDDVGEPIVTDQTISVTPWDYLNSWLSTISGTLGGIRTGVQSLVESLSHVGETILEAVETGPIKLFQTVLGLISSSFASVFERIRSGLGIWHYVVSWLGSISAPLTFLSSVVPSGIFIPVYASVAGSLVIAIFRRFGR